MFSCLFLLCGKYLHVNRQCDEVCTCRIAKSTELQHDTYRIDTYRIDTYRIATANNIRKHNNNMLVLCLHAFCMSIGNMLYLARTETVPVLGTDRAVLSVPKTGPEVGPRQNLGDRPTLPGLRPALYELKPKGHLGKEKREDGTKAALSTSCLN